MDEDGGLGLPQRDRATMAACIEVAAGAAELNSCRGWAIQYGRNDDSTGDAWVLRA